MPIAPTNLASFMQAGPSSSSPLRDLAARRYKEQQLQAQQARQDELSLRQLALEAQAAQGAAIPYMDVEAMPNDFTDAAKVGYYGSLADIGQGKAQSGSGYELKYGADGALYRVNRASGEPEQVLKGGLRPNQGIDYLTDKAGIGTRAAVDRKRQTTDIDIGSAAEIESEKKRGAYEGERTVSLNDRRRDSTANLNAEKRTHKTVKRSTDKALELIRAGKGVGQDARFTPEWIKSNKGRLSNLLTTIQGDIGLGKLIELKRKGGTLGALSEKELQLLISLAGPLDQMYPQDLEDTLMDLMTTHDELLAEMQFNHDDEFGARLSAPKQRPLSVGGNSIEDSLR